MRSILILNPKGGCGKTTLATNIAGWFAMQGKKVSLADCDPQGSSTDWLAARPDYLAKIELAAMHSNELEINRDTEILVIDSPAAIHDKKLVSITRAAQTIVMPMMPSAIDVRAAERFLRELIEKRREINRKVKLATVANRVREDTLSGVKLEYYLETLKLPNGSKVPYITMLRASQNYVHAAEKGMTIFELAPSKTVYDREQWMPLLAWLSSARSIPSIN